MVKSKTRLRAIWMDVESQQAVVASYTTMQCLQQKSLLTKTPRRHTNNVNKSSNVTIHPHFALQRDTCCLGHVCTKSMLFIPVLTPFWLKEFSVRSKWLLYVDTSNGLNLCVFEIGIKKGRPIRTIHPIRLTITSISGRLVNSPHVGSGPVFPYFRRHQLTPSSCNSWHRKSNHSECKER